MTYTYRVDESNRGKRVDKLLTEQLNRFPRTAIHKLFDAEKVLLNDKPAKAGTKLRTGDVIKADVDILDIVIEDIDLPIIFEDDNVIVINKPSGVISHARGRYFDEPSVASFVRQKSHQDGERAGIVHRLDRATSGVMITAKNSETLSYLQKQFSNRTVKKIYTAIIVGSLATDTGVIDMPIARNPNKPQTFIVSHDGKNAKTRYEVLKRNGKYSLVKLSPETGRTHQLRVHLKQLGHPIVGDELYGGEHNDRLLLHAASLEITIPEGDRRVFTCPLPNSFDKLMSDNS